MSVVLYSYTLCVLVLFAKMFAISLYQGAYRIGRLTFKNAEDAGFVGRPASAEELPQVSRASQAWMNDLENIPLFFVLGGIYVLLEGPAGPAVWLFSLFTAARIVHTVTYLARWQPWRTLAYAVGVVCLFGIAGLIIAQLAARAG
ncbi:MULTISPECIES: MAPEG family protein [Pseudomonas]|jgi:glutathione S-transferase|uniref:Microsomal glutathione S-transferase 1 n=1 Tax=Pseudomonas mosselii TaxID=78327 RepID=A0ABX9B098_9PSED|nr:MULTISPECIES: MAPEG family protein [Pseudomonas]MDC0687222.1 MAPEG family protein [Mitsuaria sp. RG]MBI6952576.1 MAPEG family protein [Pseudomonas sp. CCOS 191]MCE0916575.1 MAPEG family protein [Pseudomonas sp. NMI760_13]MCF1486588.1 MAPEG family protein [Pseudomonas sp. AA27]MCP8636132.1 MAPEG family protein [Pseudomonas sp. DVZ6]